MGDLSVNILLYDDNIVIRSKVELHDCLHVLYEFCSSWKLQVNIEISYVLVFNSNSKSFIDEFNYNGKTLEALTYYCYQM